ncbi:hypothetical protein TYRP_016723 [Tyrophagus putrescentiae]|nr:hypothetical protein TYRP_016723 [Tyrophagus putrescentiae]
MNETRIVERLGSYLTRSTHEFSSQKSNIKHPTRPKRNVRNACEEIFQQRTPHLSQRGRSTFASVEIFSFSSNKTARKSCNGNGESKQAISLVLFLASEPSAPSPNHALLTQTDP